MAWNGWPSLGVRKPSHRAYRRAFRRALFSRGPTGEPRGAKPHRGTRLPPALPRITQHRGECTSPSRRQLLPYTNAKHSSASQEVTSSCAQHWGGVKKPDYPPYAWSGFGGSDRPRVPRRQGIVAPLGKHIILYPTSGAESVAAGTRRGTVLVYVNPQYVLPVSPDVSATGPHPLVPADSHAHSLLLGSRFA